MGICDYPCRNLTPAFLGSTNGAGGNDGCQGCSPWSGTPQHTPGFRPDTHNEQESAVSSQVRHLNQDAALVKSTTT